MDAVTEDAIFLRAFGIRPDWDICATGARWSADSPEGEGDPRDDWGPVDDFAVMLADAEEIERLNHCIREGTRAAKVCFIAAALGWLVALVGWLR